MKIEIESYSDFALACELLTKVDKNTPLFYTLVEKFLVGYKVFSKDHLVKDMIVDKKSLKTLKNNYMYLWEIIEEKDNVDFDDPVYQLAGLFQDLIGLTKLYTKNDKRLIH
jgi:hypothetical protein